MTGRARRAGPLRLVERRSESGLRDLGRMVREAEPDLRAEAIAQAITEELGDFDPRPLAMRNRVELALHVGLLSDGEYWVGWTESLDERSVFVRTYLAKPIGTDVELLLELPDGRVIDVHGVVAGVRRDPHSPLATPGIDVRIVSMSGPDTDAYAEVLARSSPEAWCGMRMLYADA